MKLRRGDLTMLTLLAEDLQRIEDARTAAAAGGTGVKCRATEGAVGPETPEEGR